MLATSKEIVSSNTVKNTLNECYEMSGATVFLLVWLHLDS